MRYQVTHKTTYEYDELVPFCQNVVHLTPRNGPYQSCLFHRLIIKPHPSSSNHAIDYFGNTVHSFSVARGHRRLSILSVSRLQLRPPVARDAGTSLPWDELRRMLPVDRSRTGLEAYQFCFQSPHVPRDAEFAAYAAPSFPPGRPIVDGVTELGARIHQDFAYDAEATTVHTTVFEVFRLRRGVCQDLAHFQLACLRSLGLAARYVSGYLRTVPPLGKPRLVGADASHAWLAVYCGSWGWVDFDPTNNVLPSTSHITLAWGRDYGDVCPVAGMFVGGGQHGLSVSVDVLPLPLRGAEPSRKSS